MQIGSQLNLNGSTNLSKIIVGYAGSYVSSFTYTQTGGIRQGTLTVEGQGPSEPGDIKVTVLCESGLTHDVSLSYNTNSNTDYFEDTTPIVGIFWGN